MSNLKYVLLLVFGLSLCTPLLLVYGFITYVALYYAPFIGIAIAGYSVVKLFKQLRNKEPKND